MFSFFSKTKSITTTELADKLTSSITLLDVRTPEEYRKGHISSAQNIPLNKISGYRGKKDTEIYVICQSGMRSKQAAKQLRDQGYDVVNVKGGMSLWSGKVRGGKA